MNTSAENQAPTSRGMESHDPVEGATLRKPPPGENMPSREELLKQASEPRSPSTEPGSMPAEADNIRRRSAGRSAVG